MTTYNKDYSVSYLNKFLNINKAFSVDLISKFNIENYFKLPKVTRMVSTIIVSSGLKNETDMKIVNSLSILDILFHKKSEITRLDSVYIKKAKAIIFTSRSTLNSWLTICTFLISFHKVIKPKLDSKFIKLKFNKFSDGFSLFLPDLSSLEELPDFLKKEKVSLKVSFFFSWYTNKKVLNILLKYFSFNKKKYKVNKKKLRTIRRVVTKVVKKKIKK